MSNAAPPAWVLALPLKSGEWRFLSRAWGYGPWGNSSLDAPPLALASVRVKACNATIGARSGQTQGAAAKQAAKLCKLGWARRNDDNTLTLAAWGWPGVFELDVAVEHGLVLRADDGNLSWPLTPQGETGHPPQGAPTPQGSPPTELSHTPHREGPHTPQEPSHPPQGAQSCLSSCCPTSELEEEERATTTPSVKPAGSGVLDPWPERVKAASVGAHYHMRSGGTGDSSYQGLLTQARHTYGDDDVIKTLLAHEARAPEHAAGRPPATQVFWSKYRPWVERVLGIEAPAPATRPGQFSMDGALRIVGGPS